MFTIKHAIIDYQNKNFTSVEKKGGVSKQTKFYANFRNLLRETNFSQNIRLIRCNKKLESDDAGFLWMDDGHGCRYSFLGRHLFHLYLYIHHLLNICMFKKEKATTSANAISEKQISTFRTLAFGSDCPSTSCKFVHLLFICVYDNRTIYRILKLHYNPHLKLVLHHQILEMQNIQLLKERKNLKVVISKVQLNQILKRSLLILIKNLKLMKRKNL